MLWLQIVLTGCLVFFFMANMIMLVEKDDVTHPIITSIVLTIQGAINFGLLCYVWSWFGL